MGNPDHQYIVIKNPPLVSVSHPSKGLGSKGVDVQHDTVSGTKTHPIVHPQNNKNTVVSSNLTYKHVPQVIHNSLPTIKKEKTKSLQLHPDTTGVHSRFAEKPDIKPNTYYILSDIEPDINDTYYLCNKAYIKSDKKVAFDPRNQPVSTNLNHTPLKHGPLSRNLENANKRLIKTEKPRQIT